MKLEINQFVSLKNMFLIYLIFKIFMNLFKIIVKITKINSYELIPNQEVEPG
jgi:hypothetical protein